jgi:glycosyltransferase involved in cell wall biosynthesis
MLEQDDTYLIKRNLSKFSYNLILARMEPENNVETIIQGHLLAENTKQLILIGNHNKGFGATLYKKYNSDKIQFWGPLYDLNILNNLRYFSHLYFHGHSVGGTNPSLLEAMASSSLIAAHNNIFNRSVLQNDAFYFDTPDDIRELLIKINNKFDYQHFINSNLNRIESEYSWTHIIDQLQNYLIYARDNFKRNTR